MSLQRYDKMTMVNGNTGTGTLAFKEFVLRLIVRRQTNGKVISKDVQFGMAGPKEALQDAAVTFAQRIAALSDGVIVNLFEKLGKYRNDELPVSVHDLKKKYATVIVSNDPRVENPSALGPYPIVGASAKVFIPWKRDDVSEQDVKATVSAQINGCSLAAAKFTDDLKSAVRVFPLTNVAGVTTKFYTKTAKFDLVNNDTNNADAVISEAFEAVIEGIDDIS